MIFKPFNSFARQVSAKTFTHGYAQSLVAATQTSSSTPFQAFGTHASSRYGKSGASQLQPAHNAFQNTPSSSGTGAKAAHSNSNTIGNEDGGLSAYYEAWQRQQQQHGLEDKEWKQYQFAKPIAWKVPSTAREPEAKDPCSQLEVSNVRAGIERAYSTSAVDDIKKVEDEAEAVAIAQVEEEIARVIKHGHDNPTEALLSPRLGSNSSNNVSNQSFCDNATTSPISSTSFSELATNGSTIASSAFSETETHTSVQESASQEFLSHISKLRDAQHYAEIPAVFETMLVSGHRPTADAYDALLDAAINIPIPKHLAVAKALDVYSDMLRRKVLPNTAAYATLLQLLSRRALQVAQMQAKMDSKAVRFGDFEGAGKFILPSDITEYAILKEDDAVDNAIKLFHSSISLHKGFTHSAVTYGLLIGACAAHGQIDSMVQVYSHMENRKVIPYAAMFPRMIEGFALNGNLAGAVQCYQAYRALALDDNNGILRILERRDNEVYVALVKAYVTCGKAAVGARFLKQVADTIDDTVTDHQDQPRISQDSMALDGLIKGYLAQQNFGDALTIAEEMLSPLCYNSAMALVCSTAADKNNLEIATKAYQKISLGSNELLMAATSMLASHLRQGQVGAAHEYWMPLFSSAAPTTALVEPAVMYATALISSGRVDEGLMTVREIFTRIRSSSSAIDVRNEAIEAVDDGIEYIGSFLANRTVTFSAQARLCLMWAMIENGGLVSSVAEQLLAGLSAEDIAKLSWSDLTLALQIEAGMLSSERTLMDIAHPARFAHLLKTAITSGVPLDQRTFDLAEKGLQKLGSQRPDLIEQWHNYCQSVLSRSVATTQYSPDLASAPIVSNAYADSFDPYATSTDFRGSTMIIEELENPRGRSAEGLNEVLLRFRNMRRAGRHPRYIAYARMISAAAKDGRTSLVHDLIALAKQDMPLLPQYRIVRHGWTSILDAMVGACLTLGDRASAGRYHQDLLEIGAAPTANTFGLYITTLKDSTKTFDEATEAVKIFQRAKTEGVEPTSFLYNALIGKLGKARRIDDCLFYFAEMRSMGIRPTSVTYGTVVNALCRVSDERYAEELFDEMESMPNYQARPAPYNSMMQFFLTTKRDSGKVLAYYERMQSRKIEPTMHTHKLLIDTYATLEPINMVAAEKVIDTLRASGQRPEAVHYASLIHAKGCVLHDMTGAIKVFDDVQAMPSIRPQACLYQALFESMVANHSVAGTEVVLQDMHKRRVDMTPYIANTLIHGWAMEKNIIKAKSIYGSISAETREPSTYEAMTRAFLTVEDRESASAVVQEMLSRGYPQAVSGKILELLGHGVSRVGAVISSEARA